MTNIPNTSKMEYRYLGNTGLRVSVLGWGSMMMGTDTDENNVDECRKDNPFVILSPDQVPMDELDYELLNTPSKNIVRQLLVGLAAETLAMIRGKFSGSINILGSPLQMDYNMLITLGNRERDNAMNELKERLLRMSPYEVMKKNADMADDLRRLQKGVPLGIYVH